MPPVRSYIIISSKLAAIKSNFPLPELARYDDNIREHLRAINARRAEPITLRYFQYLALLYTEVFLDSYFNRQREMLRAINAFTDEA